MPNYVYLQHYTNQGDLGISKDVFESLAQHVITYIREKNNSKNQNFEISDTVDVSLRSNKVIYKFYIKRTGDFNLKNLDKIMKDYIESNLNMICEAVDFDISFKVTGEDGK